MHQVDLDERKQEQRKNDMTSIHETYLPKFTEYSRIQGILENYLT